MHKRSGFLVVQIGQVQSCSQKSPDARPGFCLERVGFYMASLAPSTPLGHQRRYSVSDDFTRSPTTPFGALYNPGARVSLITKSDEKPVWSGIFILRFLDMVFVLMVTKFMLFYLTGVSSFWGVLHF